MYKTAKTLICNRNLTFEKKYIILLKCNFEWSKRGSRKWLLKLMDFLNFTDFLAIVNFLDFVDFLNFKDI